MKKMVSISLVKYEVEVFDYPVEHETVIETIYVIFDDDTDVDASKAVKAAKEELKENYSQYVITDYTDDGDDFCSLDSLYQCEYQLRVNAIEPERLKFL